MANEAKIYCGKGRRKDFDGGGFRVNLDIRPDQIPAANGYTDKGGNKHVKLTLTAMKQADQYGNDCTIYCDMWQPVQSASGASGQTVSQPGGKSENRQEPQGDGTLPF